MKGAYVVEMRLGQSLELETTGSWGRGVEGAAGLFANLGPAGLVTLFTALLAEKRVLVAGDTVRLLSLTITSVLSGVSWQVARVARTVGALAGLLSPLEWPHTLFPIVPDTHVHLAHCPTPYLIGILRANLNQLKVASARSIMSQFCRSILVA